MPEPLDTRQRLRITFSQDERIKYVGHLDMARTWERALRRAEFPVSYTRGFNPQLRIMFASAMPVGFTGLSEVLDLVLDEPVDLTDFKMRLAAQLPPALRVLTVHEVPVPGPALQAMLRAVEYRVGVESACSDEEITPRVADLLQAQQVPRQRQRKGKPINYDLRPLIEVLKYEGVEQGRHWFWMRLHSEPAATGRPDEVLLALDLDPLGARIERQRLIFSEDRSYGGIQENGADLEAEPGPQRIAEIACS